MNTTKSALSALSIRSIAIITSLVTRSSTSCTLGQRFTEKTKEPNVPTVTSPIILYHKSRKEVRSALSKGSTFKNKGGYMILIVCSSSL